MLSPDSAESPPAYVRTIRRPQLDAAMSRKPEDTAIARLEDASKWLITEAVAELYQEPRRGDQIQSALLDRFKLRSYNKPGLDSETSWPHFIPFSRGIYYDISVVASETIGHGYFEYWFIAVTQQAWVATAKTQCRFIVTQAESKTSNRAILKNEGRFFDQYDVDGRAVFKLFPEADLRLRSRLTPWLLPSCFENRPDLLEEEVSVLQDGSYVLRPISAATSG
jgi:hypothetical protein